MKRYLAIFLFLFLPALARASTPHYINGTEGLDIATMPPPGFYYRLYNMFYTADSVRNNHGDKINVDFNIDSFMEVHRFLYATDFKILGGRYAVDISVPLINLDFSVKNEQRIRLPDMTTYNLDFSITDSTFGVSDIVVDPMFLTWDGDRYQVTAGVGVYIPVGKYDHKDPSSVGKGFWTFAPGIGATFFLDEAKTWTFSTGLAYEIHTKQRQTDVTPGNHFHVGWGLGKQFGKYLQVGAAGYDSWQITKDKGPSASANKTTAHAAGPEIVVSIPKLDSEVSLRSLWEYANKNGAQGNITVLTWTFSF